jgi:hypothetical protein
VRAAMFRAMNVWKVVLVRTGRKSLKIRSCIVELNIMYSEGHRSAVARLSLVSEVLIQYQTVPCGIYGKLRGSRKGFSARS